MARSVVRINQKTPITGRGYLALGIGCCCKATTGEVDLLICRVRSFVYLYVTLCTRGAKNIKVGIGRDATTQAFWHPCVEK